MVSKFRRSSDGGRWKLCWTDPLTGRRRERSTGTQDEREAERQRLNLEASLVRIRAGEVNAAELRAAEANRRPLSQHLEEWRQELVQANRSHAHVTGRKRHLERFAKVAAARRISDVHPENVSRFVERFLGQRPRPRARTVNAHLSSVRAFARWCVRTGRVVVDPLPFVPRLDERGDRARERRALTVKQVRTLLKVARARGRAAWYLLAVWAGLRRGDLERLTWGAVNLDWHAVDGRSWGLVTISRGKARRTDRVPLHPEAVDALRALRPALVTPAARVFPHSVQNRTRIRDFKAAGIPEQDESGRVADLHSLRMTLHGWLVAHGVHPRVAQGILRHANYQTTASAYTDLDLRSAAEAMSAIPDAGSADSRSTNTLPQRQVAACGENAGVTPSIGRKSVGAQGIEPWTCGLKSRAEDRTPPGLSGAEPPPPTPETAGNRPKLRGFRGGRVLPLLREAVSALREVLPPTTDGSDPVQHMEGP